MSEKFLFEQSFELDSPDGQAAPKIREQDIKKAREEGFAAGVREAAQTAEQLTSQSLSAITQQLKELTQSQADASNRNLGEAIETATTIVRKLFPKLVNAHGMNEIESLVRECLERLRDEPRVVIRVADALLDNVKERINILAVQSGFDGKIVFLSQDGMKPGDAKVEWADGGAERDSQQIWCEIDKIIERTTGSKPRPVPMETPSTSEAIDSSAAEPASSGPVVEDAAVSA